MNFDLRILLKRIVLLAIVSLIFCFNTTAGPQTAEGELRVSVRDSDGLAVPARIEVTGRNPRFEAQSDADATGFARLSRIPLGVYSLVVAHPGFEERTEIVEIRSGVPRVVTITLNAAGVATAIIVTGNAPLLDVTQPTSVMQIGRSQLEEIPATSLGRSAVDVVTTLPGWLLEANAVLHPRGSEYDTQYVVDGMPVYDNRSIGFAPPFESSEFESVNVMTAGMPAEFGRRMGGVIALDTRRVGTVGSSTEFNAQVGSLGNKSGSVRHQFRTERTSISGGIHGGTTDRYLDPPLLENFTNKATAGGSNVRVDRDFTDNDRMSFYIRSNEARFLVPNDLIQQMAGQRQDRFSGETAAQVHYYRVFSSRALGSFRFMYRDLSARLWSNRESTPVRVEQDRGLKEGVLVGDLTLEGEYHTFKLGGDLRINKIREEFRFGETDEFPAFAVDFRDAQQSNEVSLFAQDHIRWGNFAANLGLRYDHYEFLINADAVSPRIGLSYWIPGAGIQIRASYDRIFQPPPLENLLLSSSAADLSDIDAVKGSLAVPASRGNFFEVGLRKPFLEVFRIDVNHYWRTFRNMMDDDVFLNTGLSFPISFDTARVMGTEVRIEMPSWRWISSSVSYSNMIGFVNSPVTGGLFIEGGEASELRDAGKRFSISQDQRNTMSALLRFEPHRRLWFSNRIQYGSGLPVELEDDDDDDEDVDGDDVKETEDEGDDSVQLISKTILDRVNFERQRIHPNFTFDISLGLRVWEKQERSVTLQVDLQNATDRLNVINFTGVFSGTALGAGRQISVQTKVRF